MPKYSINIGVVCITSEQPITDEQRKRVIQALKLRSELMVLDGGLVVTLDIKK